MKLQYGEPEALVQESNSSLNFEYCGNNVSDEGEVSDSNCSRKKDFEVHKNMLINIKEIASKWFESSSDDKEIIDFIAKIQLKEVMETYSVHIKTFFISFIIILLYIIYVHSNMNEFDELSYIIYRQCWGCVLISLISLMILTCFPTYYIVIARMLLAFVIIGMADLSTALPEYGIHEYTLPCLSFGYIMIIISPNYWKSNCLIFALCFLYFALKIYFKYGYLPEKFKLTTYACLFYFVTAAILLNSKLKRLCVEILKSEKLVKEMKKLLTIFPNGVIIHSGYSQENCETVFSNIQFQTQIIGIKKKIDSFDSIEVKFKNSSQTDKNSVSMSLKKLLKIHQKRSAFNEIVHQDKVNIKCIPSKLNSRYLLEEDQKDEDSNERIFNIKSMEVDWEDKHCFMHVFVDTTDFVKLEEANNNIKCQKIMFTSASHEFRTPLNAISNSFSLIEGRVKEIFTKINKFCRNCK